MKSVKILMYKKGSIFYVYDTLERDIVAYTRKDIDKIINSGETIRYMDDSKRKSGDIAVVYRSDPKRFIVVTPRGTHLFRTITELSCYPELYFNIDIIDDKVKPLDGSLVKADNYIKNVTYISMFKPGVRVLFALSKTTGDAYLEGFEGSEIQNLFVPNFVHTIKARSLADKHIEHIGLSMHLKRVEALAFENSIIRKLSIECDYNNIEPLAFNGAEIGEIKLSGYSKISDVKIFEGSSIGLLDMSYSKVTRLDFRWLSDNQVIRTIKLPISTKSINIDNLPVNIHSIILRSKNTDIQCSNKDKQKKLKDKQLELPTNNLELVIDNC